MTRRYWTPAEEALLRELYPHMRTSDIATRMQCSASRVYVKARQLGIRKSAEYLASADACRLRRGDNLGAAYRYPKGNVPMNKGLRRPGWGTDTMKANWFKPGARSLRWPPDDYPVGALRINADGALDMKVHEGPRAWVSLARWTWERERGPIPQGMSVRSINGDRHDCRVENLRLATRAELMRENTIHNYPPEIARAVQLVGALNRKINQRTGDGSKKHRSAA